MTALAPHAKLASLSKLELHHLAEGLLNPGPWVVERCVEFVLAETRGIWHGRARALMCRRLKHCHLGRTHSNELLVCIINRLKNGTFSEQFKDQLRLAMHIDHSLVAKASSASLGSQKQHVRRYAQWVISHSASTNAA